MKKLLLTMIISVFFLTGCLTESSTRKEAQVVAEQQNQYAISQPVPRFDYSLERDLLIQLYNIRNTRAVTHSVWRSNTGMIEGDCASIGFGIPFDTSLTNPLTTTVRSPDSKHIHGLATVEQAEPNGVFASKNTNATWVLCTGKAGVIEPVYVESKVTAYPYPLTVDYDSNRVYKRGEASVTLD